MTFTGLLTLSAIAWFLSGWIWLPHPRQANQAELLRWLVLRDISSQSIDVQLVFVDRLEEELQQGLQTDSPEELSAAYSSQLSANIANLKQLWFVTRCRQYELSDTQMKGEFLSRRLKTIWSWAQLKVPHSNSPGTDLALDDPALAFFDDIEKWVENAAADDRVRMEAAVRDGFIYWMAHYDLVQLSMHTRQDLARRIVRELNRGMGQSLTPFALSTANRTRLRKNFLEILSAWFHSLAGEFAQLPNDAKQRNQFVDKVLDQVFRWNLTKFWSQFDASSRLGIETTLLELDKRIAVADQAQQQQLRKLYNTLTNRGGWRLLNRRSGQQ